MSTMTAPSASLGQEPIGDRASNVLHYIRHPLQAVPTPRSAARIHAA